MFREGKSKIMMAGAISGGLWFLLALAFDNGVRDFNFSVIPTNSHLAYFGSGLSGVLTGVGIALLFHRLLLSKSRVVFFALPIATLSTAIVTFSILIWITWLALGNHAGVPALGRLADILSIFLVYGLMSLFTPVVYACALLNQYVLRAVIGCAT